MINLKPEDVRIGNYVKYKDRGCKVIAIYSDVFTAATLDEDTATIWESDDGLEPVPLDENWLARMPGCNKASKNSEYGGWLLSLKYGNNAIRIHNNEWDNGLNKVELKWVHQLQNLYKVLTGYELY